MSNKSFNAKILICVSTAFLLISAFTCSSNTGSSADTSSVKFKQYYVKGEELYLTHCSNCHQKDGSGLGLIYPPLNQSDYMDKNFNDVLCLMKHGMKGEVIVNGKSFSQTMPGIFTLTNLEIAEIGTYIYNTWENERGIVDVAEATRALDSCTLTSK